MALRKSNALSGTVFNCYYQLFWKSCIILIVHIINMQETGFDLEI